MAIGDSYQKQVGVGTGLVAEDASSGNPDSLKSSSGALRVLSGVSGIARNRFISATTGTLPTLAGSGVATWNSPGVRGIVIESVRVISGTLPTAANADLTVRYAVDAANDAAAAILIPVTPNTSSATADVGQVGSFCLLPVQLTGVQLLLLRPVEIDVDSPILRLDLIHNIGTTVVLQFGISAMEEI